MANRSVEITTRILGLEVQPEAVGASPQPVAHTLIPFLKPSAADGRALSAGAIAPQLRFEKLDQITQRRGIPRFPNIKTLDTVTNPSTQIVYKISSPWAAGAPPIAPFPSADEEERQLRNLGERFVALPDAEPAIDFYTALKSIAATAPVVPQNAAQLIAYLVTHHTRKYDPRLVWIIQTRGVAWAAEGYAAMGNVPVDARNHLRHIIDATTGEWLYSDTAPQPV